jgi:hypothetical protein
VELASVIGYSNIKRNTKSIDIENWWAVAFRIYGWRKYPFQISLILNAIFDIFSRDLNLTLINHRDIKSLRLPKA